MQTVEKEGREPVRRLEIVGLLVIVAVAAVLRFYRLDAAPPGPMWDHLANIIDADAIRRGERPIFLFGNTGREPFLHYILALGFSVLGVSVTSYRLVSGLLGIATIVAVYGLARELFGRRVALLSGALLAGSLWHIALTRLGFRTMTMALISSIAFWLLWRGWRLLEQSSKSNHALSLHRSPSVSFALGGAFLGLSLYTYIPARLFPILAVFLVGLWLLRLRSQQDPPGLMSMLAGSALSFGLVAAPFGWYAMTHAPDVLYRASTVALKADSEVPFGLNLLDNSLRTLGMFVVVGDRDPHHNLPYRPVFDMLTSPMFVIGMASVIWRVADPRRAFMILWFALLLIPGAISIDAPHYLRTAGAIPAVYVIAGLGGARLLDWIQRLPWQRAPRYAPALIAGLLVVSTLGTAQDYFNRLATRADAYRAGDADAFDAARLLLKAPDDGERLLGVRTYRGQSGQLLLMDAESRARAFDANRTLVIPSVDGRPVWYAVVVGRPVEREGEERLRSLLQPGELVESQLAPDGIEAAQLWRFEPQLLPRLSPDREILALIGDSVELLGYDLPRRAHPGDTVTLGIHWRVVGHLTPGRFWQFFAHLARDGQAWASDYHEGFQPGQWRVGDRVVSWHTLRLPPSLPVDTYMVEFGMFERETVSRLSIVDGQRRPIGDVLLLGPIRIAQPRPDMPNPSRPAEYSVGDKISLVGFDKSDAAVQPGGKLSLTLYWRASDTIPVNYTVFTHLVDANGRLVAQKDNPPQQGAYPTTLWAPDEVVRDEYEIIVPTDARPGSYRLLVGMYRVETGERLAIGDSRGRPVGDTIPLVDVEVSRP